MMDLGPQYQPDHPFKAAARLHQSIYHARVLQVGYSEYGNRLTEDDGRALLNYYPGLGVREALRERYPAYSGKREADLLRSEHIPFNLLAPLACRPVLMGNILREAFSLDLFPPFRMQLEWAPSPAEEYLDDRTSFDAYIEGSDIHGERVGLGIEVKYTELGYRMGSSEAGRVRDRESTYWVTTRKSGLFLSHGCDALAGDDLRQIWRNHLLGAAMVNHGDIAKFVSLTLYPAGNQHFTHALAEYRSHLKAAARDRVRGCTFEEYINCLRGDDEIEAWKEYLQTRYLFVS
nr:hypothetical protein [Anaerolineae bacterium]